ncbi:GIY-YIG nuclease family protein [Vibrio vulnificus]|nr:GIY-YIG nuclease family protein [Vibrio vulnificus]EGR0072899.1 GIY-YIG nuclease family protein [Vibrio vulnificus]ELV8693045.1 GIY-YIG nuclease family protein [Vibrio vulnificus]HAS8128935.1 GIY-YIG nuclease family protein [Vibrio vulnificus]
MRHSPLNAALALLGVTLNVQNIKKNQNGKFVADVHYDSGEYYFTTQEFETYELAENWISTWSDWANQVCLGTIDSIYYIIQVPDTWAGPHENAHQFQGLFVKIGRSKNVLTRLRNLQTGTFGQLVIGALEPGGSKREAELHKKFARLRRQGEWFSCNQELCDHIFNTWYRNKMLPPEHQHEMLRLAERINAYMHVKKLLGKTPDTINPSLDEDWHGVTFVDLVYSSLAKPSKK